MPQSQPIPSYYSNAVSFSASAFDVTLTFGVNEPQPNEEGVSKIAVRPFMNLAMSPQHFKVFMKVATEFLANYEKEFGEIKTPPRKGESAK